MKKLLLAVIVVLVAGMKAHAVNILQGVTVPSTIVISSVTAATNTAVTATVPAPSTPTYSTGYYNYITNISIDMYATGTLTGGATPVYCTTTGLANNPKFTFPTAAATGTDTLIDRQYANPMQGVQGTPVTVVCPATGNVHWNVQVGYFQGQ